MRRFRQMLNTATARQMAWFSAGMLLLFDVAMLAVWAVFDPGLFSLWPQFLLLNIAAALGVLAGVRMQSTMERDSQTMEPPAPPPAWLERTAWVFGWIALAGAVVVVLMLVLEGIRVF